MKNREKHFSKECSDNNIVFFYHQDGGKNTLINFLKFINKFKSVNLKIVIKRVKFSRSAIYMVMVVYNLFKTN